MRGFLVFCEHRFKTVGVPRGLRHNARLVCIGFLLQTRGRTDSTGHHIIGVSFGFILGAFTLLAGLQHIVKGGLHWLRGTNSALLQIDANDFNTDFVAVQDGLHQGTDARGNLIALFCQSRVHAHLADHFADGGLSGLHDGFAGVTAFEQPSPRIVQTVLNRKLDFHNVFVLREHGRVTQARGLDDGVMPHIDRTNLGHKDKFMALNGIRQTPIEARSDGFFVASELGDDRLLAFLHNEEARAQPNQRRDQQHGQDSALQRTPLAGRAKGTTRATTLAPPFSTAPVGAWTLGRFRGPGCVARAFTAKPLTPLAVQVPPDFFQVRRLLALVKNPAPCARHTHRTQGALSALGLNAPFR